MTTPTHIILGGMTAYLVTTTPLCVIMCVIGSILPDIDNKGSYIGRLLPFFSHPINRRFGHRKTIHGRPLWLFVCLLSLLPFSHFDLLIWVGLGALSHCFIDQMNKPGVQTWMPISNKTVVLFKRSWRIYNGSPQEYALVFLFCVVIWSVYEIRDMGGMSIFVNRMSGAHKITAVEALKAGNSVCYVKGQWRHNTGSLESIDWLVVGTEKKKLVYWSGSRFYRDNQDGIFLSSYLVKTKKRWTTLNIKGLATLSAPAWFLSGGKWQHAPPGRTVAGTARLLTTAVEIQPDNFLGGKYDNTQRIHRDADGMLIMPVDRNE